MEEFNTDVLAQINLKGDFDALLNDFLIFDESFSTNSIMYECFSGFAFLTKSDLKGKYLENYLLDLKQDIVEFFDEQEKDYSYQTLENLAFFRLNKAAMQYDLARKYIQNEEQLTQLSNKAKSCKKDLDIIQALAY